MTFFTIWSPPFTITLQQRVMFRSDGRFKHVSEDAIFVDAARLEEIFNHIVLSAQMTLMFFCYIQQP